MKSLKVAIILSLKFLLYIVAILLSVLIIRLFLFNFYVVSSDSMEPAILPGDFIAVNKSIYGARIFTSLKFDKSSDPSMKRVPGLRRIRRHDILVFNFPYRRKKDTIRMNLEKIYVKRCIGLPGDSISAINGLYHVAGYTDTLGYVSEQKKLAELNSMFALPTPQTSAFLQSLNWDIVNFGPLYIPASGKTIALTRENFNLYHKLLVYETGASIRQDDSLTYINNLPATHYTFRSNWYFVAGDMVMYSEDSRYFGLIPEAYIIGKVGRIMWSKDIHTGEIQWSRTMKKIR